MKHDLAVSLAECEDAALTAIAQQFGDRLKRLSDNELVLLGTYLRNRETLDRVWNEENFLAFLDSLDRDRLKAIAFFLRYRDRIMQVVEIADSLGDRRTTKTLSRLAQQLAVERDKKIMEQANASKN